MAILDGKPISCRMTTQSTTRSGEPHVLWYGERGVINAVVAHIVQSRRLAESVRSALSAVCWGDNRKPEWVRTITEVRLLVEVGLADFGDPDLMLICNSPQGIKLVFVEAKVVSYLDSMQPTSPSTNSRWGMAQPGFNSSINGQLSLKYRFACALSVWKGAKAPVAEPPRLFAAYQQRLNDSAAKAPGRILAKPSILRLLQEVGLAGISIESCYFVALTWDCAERAFNLSKETPTDCLPVFLNEEGKDVFGESAARVGWLGYTQLVESLGLRDNREFMHALMMMVEALEPSTREYIERRSGRWDSFPRAVVALADKIAERFQSRAVRYPGSYSIQDENKQTVGKIIPADSSVFVGIRVGFVTADDVNWKQVSTSPRKVKNVTFLGTNVDSVESARAFFEALGVKLLSETVPADTSEPDSV